MENEKILLNVEETANYLNLGKTKTRELMKENEKKTHKIQRFCAFFVGCFSLTKPLVLLGVNKIL